MMEENKKNAKMKVLRELLNFGDEELDEKLKPKATVISIGIGKPELEKSKLDETKEEEKEMMDEEEGGDSYSKTMTDEEKKEIDKIRQKYLGK